MFSRSTKSQPQLHMHGEANTCTHDHDQLQFTLLMQQYVTEWAALVQAQIHTK